MASVFYKEKLSRKRHGQADLLKLGPRTRSPSSSCCMPASVRWGTARGRARQRPHFCCDCSFNAARSGCRVPPKTSLEVPCLHVGRRRQRAGEIPVTKRHCGGSLPSTPRRAGLETRPLAGRAPDFKYTWSNCSCGHSSVFKTASLNTRRGHWQVGCRDVQHPLHCLRRGPARKESDEKFQV